MRPKLTILMLVLLGVMAGREAQAFYNPSTGRWLSRDPIQEHDGPNIYTFVGNNPVNKTDMLGMWVTEVHHQIVLDWLDEKYDNYPWKCCCKIPVRSLLMAGSDEVDGEWGNAAIDLLNPDFWVAQSSANAYQHAMRSPGESVASAQAKYDKFLADNTSKAQQLAAQARGGSCGSLSRKGGYPYACAKLHDAIRALGKAYHAYSDSLSPAHAGFQTWYGPIDASIGPLFVFGNWVQIRDHKPQETLDKYEANWKAIRDAVEAQFQSTLDGLLQQ